MVEAETWDRGLWMEVVRKNWGKPFVWNSSENTDIQIYIYKL